MVNQGRTFYCGEGFSAARTRYVPLLTGCCSFPTVLKGDGRELCGQCGQQINKYLTPSGVRVGRQA